MEQDPKLRNTVTVHAYAVTVVDESQRGAPPSESAIPPSVVVLPSVGDVVGSVYRLTRLLGAGMFGRVYVAQRQDVPEHQVALKILPRSHYVGRNVERELVMLATVGHPNVVQLKDHGMTAEYVWLTMPVYSGETLGERLERGPLGLREAHEIFLAIARGLEALHAAGLRHQDIKPDNIFLARFGGRVHPILLDLGVAAEREATFVAGTALYASPEQLASMRGSTGELPLSEKMDTYCLAATLLVSLVGEDRFPGGSAGTMEDLSRALDIRADTPLPGDALLEAMPEARDNIEKTLARWLAIDPTKRPSMSALAEELDVLLEPEREVLRSKERAAQRQKAALQWFRIAAGALFLIAGAGAWIAYSKRETIQLATELEKVRAQEQESFDKLDVCNASYKTALGDVHKCKASRDKERKIFEEQLDAQMKLCESGTELDCALETKKIRDQGAARLRACEDDAMSSVKESEAAMKQLKEDFEKQRTALAAERDEQKALADKRAEELKALTAERDKCAQERGSCIEERDALRQSPLGTKGSSSGSTIPAGSSSSSSPNAPPGPTTIVTSGPIGPPAPPPPPPPTPPAPVDDDDPYN